jgi:hypothetical protein
MKRASFPKAKRFTRRNAGERGTHAAAFEACTGSTDILSAQTMLKQLNYELFHHDGAASHEATGAQHINPRPLIKIGLVVHRRFYVAVAQHDHAMPRTPRRFSPEAFVPWVKTLLPKEEVHIVYESCGFGFELHRALLAIGAHCCVIRPQKLDERHTGVKTDGRDARALCQRLSRHLDVNRHELAVMRVPSREEEQRRHFSRSA